MKSIIKAAFGAALLWSAQAGATIVQRYAIRYDAFGPDLRGAATQVLVDAEGGTRMVGQYADRLLVARFDVDGNMLWSQELPGLAVAPSGGWAPGQGAAINALGTTFVLTTSGHLLAIDASGFPWDADLTVYFGPTFQPVAVVVDAAGTPYVAGHVANPTFQQDVLVARLAASLGPAWTRVLDRAAGVDQVTQLRLRPQGGVVLAGSSDGALSIWGFDAAGVRALDVSGPPMTVGGLDVAPSGAISVGGTGPAAELLAARYDAAGNPLWTATAVPYRGVSAVRTASDGSLYVAGYSNTTGTFYVYDLLKFSADGQLLWERNYSPYGDSQIFALELDRDEPVITGEYGYCYGQVMTMKHSAAGDLLWQAGYQPPQTGCGSVNYGLALAIDAQRNVHVAGYTLDSSTAIGQYPYKPTLLKYADVDTTPPATTASLAGTGNGNGWYRSAVTVTLSAADAPDAASGVREIRWSLDGGAAVVVPGATASLTVSSDGRHTLTFQAVDAAGNVEALQTVPVNVDRARPAASIRATPSLLKPANGRMVPVVVSGSASDALSGVASTAFTVADEYGLVQPALSAFGQTILLQASRKASDRDGRVYTISVRVTDLAGNVTTASTRVTVP